MMYFNGDITVALLVGTLLQRWKGQEPTTEGEKLRREVVQPLLQDLSAPPEAQARRKLMDALAFRVAQGDLCERDVELGSFVASGGFARLQDNWDSAYKQEPELCQFAEGLLEAMVSLEETGRSGYMGRFRGRGDKEADAVIKQRLEKASLYLTSLGLGSKGIARSMNLLLTSSDEIQARHAPAEKGLFPQSGLAIKSPSTLEGNFARASKLLCAVSESSPLTLLFDGTYLTRACGYMAPQYGYSTQRLLVGGVYSTDATHDYSSLDCTTYAGGGAHVSKYVAREHLASQVYAFYCGRADARRGFINVSFVPLDARGDAVFFATLVGKHLVASDRAGTVVAGIGHDNDGRFELMDDVLLGVESSIAKARSLEVPFFKDALAEPVDLPGFPFRVVTFPRNATPRNLPFYGSRDQRHVKKCCAFQILTAARVMSVGELTVTHTPLLPQGIPLKSYVGVHRQSDEESADILGAYPTTAWNGEGREVYACLQAALTRATWDRTLHRMERLLFALFSYYGHLMCAFQAQNLDREFMHPISLRAVTRCAAQLVIKVLTYPEDLWGPLNPSAHQEWFAELCFGWKRNRATNANFNVASFAKLCAEYNRAEKRRIDQGKYGCEPPPAHKVLRSTQDQIAMLALKSATRLIALCCPNSLSDADEEDLRTNFLCWCGGSGPLIREVLGAEDGLSLPVGDCLSALQAIDDEDAPWSAIVPDEDLPAPLPSSPETASLKGVVEALAGALETGEQAVQDPALEDPGTELVFGEALDADAIKAYEEEDVFQFFLALIDAKSLLDLRETMRGFTLSAERTEPHLPGGRGGKRFATKKDAAVNPWNALQIRMAETRRRCLHDSGRLSHEQTHTNEHHRGDADDDARHHHHCHRHHYHHHRHEYQDDDHHYHEMLIFAGARAALGRGCGRERRSPKAASRVGAG